MASRPTRSVGRRRIAPEALLRPSTGSARAIGSGLMGSSAWYLTAIAAMVSLMATASPADRLEDQLTDDPDLLAYRLPFVAASLLAPAFISMLVLLVWARGEGIGLRDGLAMLLLPGYLICSSVAYVSQYAMLPRLVELDPAAATAWYFQDERSIPFALDLLGYAFMGLAMCLLAGGFLDGRGLMRTIGWSLIAVGSTSVAAFTALASGSDVATAVLTWTSAGLTLPLTAAAIVLGLRLRRQRPSVLDTEMAGSWA
jgi:hypothetical protein